jgi:hypothetical protein
MTNGQKGTQPKQTLFFPFLPAALSSLPLLAELLHCTPLLLSGFYLACSLEPRTFYHIPDTVPAAAICNWVNLGIFSKLFSLLRIPDKERNR